MFFEFLYSPFTSRQFGPSLKLLASLDQILQSKKLGRTNILLDQHKEPLHQRLGTWDLLHFLGNVFFQYDNRLKQLKT